MQRERACSIDIPGARSTALPDAVEPMLASLADRPFSSHQWLFEPKLDGVRAIALIHDGKVRLLSRRGLNTTAQFPEVAAALARQPKSQLVLDGEIVALDDHGRPSFQRLQRRLGLTRDGDIRRVAREVSVIYYVFDLLYVDDCELRSSPLEARKSLLGQVLQVGDVVRLVEYFPTDGRLAFETAVRHGLEGVVAKRRDSRYESGCRSRNWLKIKETQSEDFVVGGYTSGEGGRAGSFGALLLGCYTERGRLMYLGGAGSGFDERTLADLRARLDRLRTERCPFGVPPPGVGQAQWVRPEIVATVKFAEVTHDGRLRAPVFLHLHPDKPAAGCDCSVLARYENREASAHFNTDKIGDELAGMLRQLASAGESLSVRVDGAQLRLNNLDKELWPAVNGRGALTKRDFISYLCQASPFLLRYLRDRPLTLIRYPHGIQGTRFFQKRWPDHLPEFVATMPRPTASDGGDGLLLCNNLATLLWLGQLADLELHCTLSRVDPAPDAEHLVSEFGGKAPAAHAELLRYPDFVLFDLDPYIYSGREPPGAEPELNRPAFDKVREVALWLKEILESLSLTAYVKTSGATGLHVLVPVVRRFDYDFVRSFSAKIARFLWQEHPEQVTLDWAVEKRRGKVFVDYNQNTRGKSIAAAYSPRATPEATVSMPILWEELGQVFPTDFTMLTAPQRLQEVGDLWANIFRSKRDLAEGFGQRGAG